MRQAKCFLASIILLLVLFTGCEKTSVNHLSLAEEYLANKQYDQSVFEFYEYMLTNPDDPRAYMGSAEAYLAMGDTAKAIEHYEMMIKNFPNNLDGYTALVPFLDKQKTIDLYLSYISQTPNSPDGYLLLGEYYKSINDTEAAQNLFLDILSRFPEVPEGYIEVGLHYFNNYRYLTAITVLQDGMRITNDNKVEDTYNYVASYVVVEWQDPIVESIIRNYLNNPTGAITLDNLSSIYSIEINGSKVIRYKSINPRLGVVEINGIAQTFDSGMINSLEDFSNFINLKELHIRSFPLDRVSSLAGLYNLNILTISNTDIESITFLGNLTSLTTLYLDDNRITSIEPLRRLANLKILSTSENFIADLSPLVDIPDLKWLDLSYNKVTDLESITKLYNLEYVDITGNRIKNPEQISLISASEILY